MTGEVAETNGSPPAFGERSTVEHPPREDLLRAVEDDFGEGLSALPPRVLAPVFEIAYFFDSVLQHARRDSNLRPAA